MSELSTGALLTRLQDEVKEALVRCLNTRATSISSYEEKQTGNAYQPVKLGEQTLHGFRASERHVWAGIDLKDRTVIDLGCNLGEIVRDAVRAGAASATGIEYDDYFVQVARYASAYNRMGNVNYFQGDLVRPETYGGTYDVVSALSVFTYIRNHIGRIAQMTKEIAVFETHSVRSDWRALYLKPLQEHFKHVAIVGVSDHKAADKVELRYILFCSQRPLDRYLAQRARHLEGVRADCTADLTRSRIAHLDAFLDAVGADPSASFDAKAAAAATKWPDLTPEMVRSSVSKSSALEAPEYWASFLRGYQEYRQRGLLDTGNFYYRSLRNLVEAGCGDAASKDLFMNQDDAVVRLSRRMGTMRQAHETGHIGEPVIAFNPVRPTALLPANHPYRLHLDPIATDIWPLALDGHHRVFAAKMAGITALPVLPMWTETGTMVKRLLDEQPALAEAVWNDVYDFNQMLCDIQSIPA